MLNDLATSYAGLPDQAARAVNFCMFAAAGLLGAMSRRNNVSITRTQYFVRLSLLGFAIALSGVAYVFTMPAIEHNLYWVITVYPLLVAMVAGFVLGRLSVARALDIGGQKQLAILGFIPVLNLYLLLKSGRTRPGIIRSGSASLLSGGKGIMIGLAIIMLGAYTSFNFKTSAFTIDDQQQLSAKLGKIANDLQPMLPITTGETVDLVMIKAARNELQRTYIVYDPAFAFTADSHDQIAAYLCSDPKIALLVNAGAVFVENYVTSQKHLNTFRVSRTDCSH
ncbi:MULTISPECIES: hypothetical protein [Thalassospira]|uniref:hypothetical protein n=1 Tax=Thalassospira TaxID=168934 RepID=UPI000C36B9ED|nr:MULTISPECIES: hypothetical protein [Thalassospira]MAL39555.1 hypothetical protein [Thalassospira sp.]MCC4241506.1 hypothetical protein [Thalassospira povalilytica]|tara:strand:- start:1265 stop:2107 length:843 start_codon:yes stop_codon:yes gene_type:complete